jgi:signal transduction histidine kinase
MRESRAPARSGRQHHSGLSLRLRLMLMLVAVFGVIQVSMSVVGLLYLRRTSNALFNDRLVQRARALTARLEGATQSYDAAQLSQIADEARISMGERLIFTVYNAQGAIVGSTAGKPVPLEAPVLAEALNGGQPVVHDVDFSSLAGPAGQSVPGRLAALKFANASGQPYVLAIAVPNEFVRSLWDELSAHAVFSTPIGLLAAGVAGWLIAGVAVRPIQRLSRIAAGLRPETLQDPIHLGSRASELTDLQTELDRMRQRLEAGYEAQERFVANVSHEIKTPIATVLTEAQTLPRNLAIPNEVRQFVESTQDEMRRLGKLVESFLLLTRVRHGKPLESTARIVSVNELVMDSVLHCRKMADQYEVRLAPELAREDERDFTVRGDPELLRTMVDNLIRNAIRFSPKTEVVTIVVKPTGGEASISVLDHGPGVPPELLDKIFDRFSQAKSEEKLGRGSGLGLEIAQGIAELHGGRITISNRAGGGCQFAATLPLRSEKPNE